MLSASNDLGGPRFLAPQSSGPEDYSQSTKLTSTRFSDSNNNADLHSTTKSQSSNKSSEALWIIACEKENNNMTNATSIAAPSASEITKVGTNQCQQVKKEEEKEGFYTDDDSISTLDTTERIKSAAKDDDRPANTAPPMPSRQTFGGRSAASASRKSILKASIEESIPISNKPRSWSKLPAPDMEQILSYRQASMGTTTRSGNTATTTTRRVKSEGYRDNKGVVFQSVIIREYQQTIGDNPSVSYGTPISLDWGYEQNAPLPLDLYEASKAGKRNLRQLFLNHYQRKNLLIHKYGHSEEEVKAAKHETNKIRSQREVSKMIQISFRPLLVLEEMRESIVRKVRRRLNKKKTSS